MRTDLIKTAGKGSVYMNLGGIWPGRMATAPEGLCRRERYDEGVVGVGQRRFQVALKVDLVGDDLDRPDLDPDARPPGIRARYHATTSGLMYVGTPAREGTGKDKV